MGTANALVPLAVAAEIARLLQEGREGKALIGGRPVAPGDMAVIVRSHRQAGYIQEALRNLGIPSVMRSDMSIFATGEAAEVCTLLRALADPGSEPKVRAALVTDILGRSGTEIARLLEDEQAWEECLETFRGYHQAWLDRGFMVMAHSLLAREGVRGRLLRRPDGERRLTNLLHCFEVIHRKAHERGLGIEGLVTWFGERVSDREVAEEYQIRLETDEKAVRIVTVHVSKGLEYPIVFCPFMWGGLRDNDEVVTFHDGFTMVKDFGSPDHDAHRVLAQKESPGRNAPAPLRGPHQGTIPLLPLRGEDRRQDREKQARNLAPRLPVPCLRPLPGVRQGWSAGWRKKWPALSAAAMEEQLKALAERGEGTIAVSPAPDTAAPGSVILRAG